MKKHKIKLAIMLPVIMAALTGCLVPHTTISGDLNKGVFLVNSPKDGDLKGLEITRETNGAVHIHVDSHTVRMNPDVVTASAAAMATVAGEVAKGVASGVSSGVKP